MELLAPAGNLEILKQAVQAGADSVYFGGQTLNARRNANNFSDEEMLLGIDYCHLYGAKSYITLNTIVFEEEWKTAEKLIETVADAGADALIVQDLGMLRLAQSICPDLPIHASTQMSAHNISDWHALEKFGVKRAVLPRELSKQEMERMLNQCAIEAEVFVHGALCMSVSGQCYFSSALGERSGNRGLCAQVCRLPFYVRDPKRHNLSLKDLSLIDEIPTLQKMGVSALKLEGRMKNAAYVVSAVKASRAVMDGKTYDPSLLEAIFSRDGFTKGYFTASLGKEMFGTRGEESYRSSPNTARTVDTESKAIIPIAMHYAARIGEPLSLFVTDCDGNTVSVQGTVCEAAHTKSVTADEIETQLKKLGSTAYNTAETLIGHADGNLFVPLSEINHLRRKTCEALNHLRIQKYKRNCKSSQFTVNRTLSSTPIQTEPKRYIRYMYANQVAEADFRFAERIFLPLEEFNKLDQTFIQAYRSRLGVELPRIYFGDEKKLIDGLLCLKKQQIEFALCHTIGKVEMARNCGMTPIGGFGLNIANSGSLDLLKDFGVEECTVSSELNFHKIHEIQRIMPIGIIAYGHFPLMITRNCPVRIETGCLHGEGCFLTDRKGKQFPVVCANGMCEIFNADPIDYADKRELLRGLDFIWFWFGPESRTECETVMKHFESRMPEAFLTRGVYLRKIL